MTTLSEAGTFTSPASTGNQTVSLDASIWAGASPKVVFLWSSWRTVDEIAVHNILSYGVGVSASSRASIAVSSSNSAGSSSCDRRHTNAACLTVITINTAATTMEADLVSFGANQFTIDWTVNSWGANYIVNFLALGGDDLTDVDLKEIQVPATPQSVPYTGVGFEPGAIIGFGMISQNAPANTTQSLHMSLGVFDGTTQRQASVSVQDGAATSNTYRAQQSSFLHAITSATGADYNKGNATSLDSDGYTIDWTATSDRSYAWVLALKGPQFKVLAADQTATNTTATRTIGFTPQAALALTAMGVSSANVEDDARIGIGAWDSANNMCFAGAVDEDAQSVKTDSDRIEDSNEFLKHIDHAQTVTGSCSLSASGNDLIETWSGVNGVQNEHILFVIGDAAAAPAADFPFRRYYQGRI